MSCGGLPVEEERLRGFACSGVDASINVWQSSDGHVVRPARWMDAAELAPRLRPADLLEIRASSGLAPQQALENCLLDSCASFAIEHRDGALLALFGVADHPLGPEIGAPWLLAALELPRIARALLREAGPWLAVLGEGRLALSNWADARNGLHLRWLARLGFARLRMIPAAGPEARPFIEFLKLTDNTSGGGYV